MRICWGHLARHSKSNGPHSRTIKKQIIHYYPFWEVLILFESAQLCVEIFSTACLVEEFLQETDASVGYGLRCGDGKSGYLCGLEVVTDKQTDALLLSIERREE